MTQNQKNILSFIGLCLGICLVFYIMNAVFHIPAYPENVEQDIFSEVEPEEDNRAEETNESYDKNQESYAVEGSESKESETLDSETEQTVAETIKDEEIQSEQEPQEKEQSVTQIESQQEFTEFDDNITFSASLPENALSNSEYFSQLLKDYKLELKEKIPENKNRQDIIIRYYHHEQDGDKAIALRNLGFYLHERPVDDAFAPYPSNTLYYGDSVSDRDIQIVAYSLISNEIEIKSIQQSRFHDSWKANAIEIGADTSIVNKANLTLDQIRAFRK